MTPTQNIRLLLEYDGTDFSGWQYQDGLPTIQGALMDALHKMTGQCDLPMACSGRTDAGVHAQGQVVNFRIQAATEARRFATGLNHHLPDTIVVHRAEAMPEAFDARRDARSKKYRYRIYEGPHPPALDAKRAWHVRRHLDVLAMQEAAVKLLGENDFESFRSVHCDAAHAVRSMMGITVEQTPRLPVGRAIDVEFHANAFCRHMCRILAGTLCQVGAGLRSPQSITDTLQARRRESAGVTAPPWGLTLMQVLF